MNLKQKWKNLSYWEKGGSIGLIIGIVIYFASFLTAHSFFEVYFEWLNPFFWAVSGVSLFCKILSYGTSEGCGFMYAYYGWLFTGISYLIIGTLIGFIYKKLKR